MAALKNIESIKKTAMVSFAGMRNPKKLLINSGSRKIGLYAFMASKLKNG